MIVTNLAISLVLTNHFLGTSPRNLALVTRLFLAGKCAQAGHKTKNWGREIDIRIELGSYSFSMLSHDPM